MRPVQTICFFRHWVELSVLDAMSILRTRCASAVQLSRMIDPSKAKLLKRGTKAIQRYTLATGRSDNMNRNVVVLSIVIFRLFELHEILKKKFEEKRKEEGSWRTYD